MKSNSVLICSIILSDKHSFLTIVVVVVVARFGFSAMKYYIVGMDITRKVFYSYTVNWESFWIVIMFARKHLRFSYDLVYIISFEKK